MTHMDTAPVMNQPSPAVAEGGRIRATARALVAAGAILLAACGGGDGGEEVLNIPIAEGAVTTASTTAPEVESPCAPTWEIQALDHGDNNRWFADGVSAIRDAHAAPTEEAREAATQAAFEWFDLAKHDPQILAGIFNYFSVAANLGNMGGITAEQLVDAANPACASATADGLAEQFSLFLSDPNVVITPGIAPANGVNSGADDNGNVVRSNREGVTGTDEERIALQFDFIDVNGNECTMWVMERCGQIVTMTWCLPPEIPTGKTDDKHPEDTVNQSVPNAPGSPGEPEEGDDPQNDGDDGFGPGDTRHPQSTTTTTTLPETAPNGETPEVGPDNGGDDAEETPLDDGGGTPDGGSDAADPDN